MFVLVFVCGSLALRWISPRTETTDVQTEANKPPPPPLPLRKTGFEQLFEQGRVLRVNGDSATVEVRELGSLDMPSGRLIACDPLVQARRPDYEAPFVVSVPPGRYPVSVSIVHGERVNRNAAVRMTVRPDPVVRWEMALQPTHDPSRLSSEEFYGFGVDTGTAAFLDADSLEALQRLGTQDGAIDRAMLNNMTAGADIRDPISGRNVMAFHAGFGDGSYPTWIGRTADNQPAVFVIDFHVVDYP